MSSSQAQTACVLLSLDLWGRGGRGGVGGVRVGSGGVSPDPRSSLMSGWMSAWMDGAIFSLHAAAVLGAEPV